MWGAAHAFSPGHGKTIVAAYLVGSRATARHALFLGATTTVTHTAGVFTLGLITLFASRYIVPEQVYPWLEVGSGALLVVLGISMFAGRVRRVAAHDRAQHAHDHDYDHDHDHPHDHDHDHHHHASHNHSHLPPGTDDTPVTWRRLLALGISGGLLPCPSALVVMLGADVGTSLMAVVFSRDLSWLSPLFIFIGVVLFIARQSTTVGRVGRILIGLGLMLLALQMVKESTNFLTQAPAIKALLSS
ncbi:MAG: ABC transporter permease, partial [Chloroflexi bacterium]|nr:ABC transporter permease [Chloroflexota bacterium]